MERTKQTSRKTGGGRVSKKGRRSVPVEREDSGGCGGRGGRGGCRGAAGRGVAWRCSKANKLALWEIHKCQLKTLEYQITIKLDTQVFLVPSTTNLTDDLSTSLYCYKLRQ